MRSVPGPARTPLMAVSQTAQVLGLVGLVWWLLQAIPVAVMLPMTQLKLTGPMPTGSGPLSEQMYADMREQLVPALLWTGTRYFMFAVASAFLVYIAIQLRNGSPRAAAMARTWTLWAVVLIALTLIVDMSIALPVRAQSQQVLTEVMSTGTSPEPLQAMTAKMIVIFTYLKTIWLVASSVILACWPIALNRWLLRIARDPVRAT